MQIPLELDIRALRKELGLTKDQLARALGVSFYNVATWEQRGRATEAGVALLRRRFPELRQALANTVDAERESDAEAKIA